MNISVFITSYNQRDYLREAIESVLAQTLPASQIIVVDDASSDGSPDLISDYARRYPDLFTPSTTNKTRVWRRCESMPSKR